MSEYSDCWNKQIVLMYNLDLEVIEDYYLQGKKVSRNVDHGLYIAEMLLY